MKTTKSLPMSFRVSDAFREALKAAAEAENRSQANMLEVMVLDYCERHGVSVPKKTTKQTASRRKR